MAYLLVLHSMVFKDLNYMINNKQSRELSYNLGIIDSQQAWIACYSCELHSNPCDYIPIQIMLSVAVKSVLILISLTRKTSSWMHGADWLCGLQWDTVAWGAAAWWLIRILIFQWSSKSVSTCCAMFCSLLCPVIAVILSSENVK